MVDEAWAGRRGGVMGESGPRRPAAEADSLFTGPAWMTRIGAANSVLTVLDAYAVAGEVNADVVKTAALEGLGYVPVVGTVITISSSPTGILELVVTQLYPGYGQLTLVLKTAAGVVRLAGDATFEPLKRDKVLLAYQGYLDPEDGGLVFGGRPRRIDSPRPSLLAPVDPTGRMSLDERRRGFYRYFSPRVEPAVTRLAGVAPDDPLEQKLWGEREAEFLPTAVRRFVTEWYAGEGPFASADENTARRMLDEYALDGIREQLVARLVGDYIAGKEAAARERIAQEEARYRALSEAMSKVAGRDASLDAALAAAVTPETFETAGDVALGLALDGMPRVAPSLRIVVAPRAREERAGEVAIRDVALRAEATASSSAEHPAPFRVRWEMRAGTASAVFGGADSRPAQIASGTPAIEVTAVLLDAKEAELTRASVTLPVRQEGVPDERQVEPEPAAASPPSR
jgi:hypothetical protein